MVKSADTLIQRLSIIEELCGTDICMEVTMMLEIKLTVKNSVLGMSRSNNRYLALIKN